MFPMTVMYTTWLWEGGGFPVAVRQIQADGRYNWWWPGISWWVRKTDGTFLQVSDS